MSSGFFMLWAGNSRSLYDRRGHYGIAAPGGSVRFVHSAVGKEFPAAFIFLHGRNAYVQN